MFWQSIPTVGSCITGSGSCIVVCFDFAVIVVLVEAMLVVEVVSSLVVAIPVAASVDLDVVETESSVSGVPM